MAGVEAGHTALSGHDADCGDQLVFAWPVILHSAGFGAIKPVPAILWSIPLGIPASWLAGRWMRGLMDEAED